MEVELITVAMAGRPLKKYMSDKLAFTATASSPPLTPTVTLDSALVAKIEAAISQTMKIYQIPGLSIGIIKDGQVAYTKGFGLAEVDTDRAVTPETVFQLASESKMMVGIAIMQLKERGKIDLDAPVTDYLPYFRLADERYKEITLRQLLSHRAGLPYSTGYTLDYQSPQYDKETLERHVRNLAGVELRSAPGEKMQYSDLAFEILGDVIAKVSGQSFEAYTQEYIFVPLGMQHTSFMVRDITPELLAAPHESDGLQPKIHSFFPYSRQHAPSSHLFSNVEDMSRFALAQLNQGQLGETKILPATAYGEMWTAQGDTNLPSQWEKEVGLGWFLGGQEGHRLVGHGGLDIGFGCGFIMAPDDGLAVMVMTNQRYSAEDFSYQVMEWLLEVEE
ncbi:MAG: serine hydrolase domain-containing protein [Anaerolineae bacterium]